GINEKTQQTLFKLENTLSRGTHGEKGSRLGLILCRDMIIQNKGKIWFESNPGEGTTFWVELPANEN
ncbi:MAG: HAMP domain-containing histidine kinase, partial [Chryseobacterium sp.]